MLSLKKFGDWPALLLISSVFLFSLLGSYGLLETSEARYAEISQEMVRSGDWTTPRYNFIKHFHKPPLIYWASAVSMKLFGENEFAARFPQALFGLGGILATFFFGKILFDKLTGFLAGLALLSTLEYFFISRYLVTDMLLTLFVTLSLLFYCKGFKEKSNQWFFFVSLGGAMLAKGPVGLFIPAMVIGLDLIIAGKGKEFFRLGWGKGFLIILCICGPWFVWLCLKNPGLLQYFVVFHTIDRFFSTVHGRGGSFFYFVPVFLIGFLPWTPFLPSLAKNYFSFKRAPEKANNRFLTIWIFAPLVFFSLSGSKLVHYLLPIFPASALLVGKMWRDFLVEPEETRASPRLFLYVYQAGFLVLGAFLIFFFARTQIFSDLAQFDLSPLRKISIYLFLLCGSGMAVALFSLKTKRTAVFFPFIVLLSLFGYLAAVCSVPLVESLFSPTTLFVKEIQKRFRPGDKIIAYRCMLNGISFYTGERIIIVAQPRETLFEKDQEEVKRYVIEDEKMLKNFFKTNNRTFLVIKSRHLEEARGLAQQPLDILAETHSYTLLYKEVL